MKKAAVTKTATKEAGAKKAAVNRGAAGKAQPKKVAVKKTAAMRTAGQKSAVRKAAAREDAMQANLRFSTQPRSGRSTRRAGSFLRSMIVTWLALVGVVVIPVSNARAQCGSGFDAGPRERLG